MARGSCNVARMDKLNRRVIYLSDEEWRAIQRYADDQGLTASAYVRAATAAIRGVHEPKDQVDVAIARVGLGGFGLPKPAPKPSRVKR